MEVHARQLGVVGLRDEGVEALALVDKHASVHTYWSEVYGLVRKEHKSTGVGVCAVASKV